MHADRRRSRRAVGGLLVAFMVVASSVRAADQSLAQVKARGALRWGGDIQGGEPYVFQDPNDGSHLVGFEVEIAEGLAKRIGVRSEFVQIDWHNLIPSLERGDFDVILNGFEVTPAHSERIAFTRPYYRFSEVLVVRTDQSGVQSLADLKSQRVGTLQESLAFELLRTADVETVLYEGVEEPYIDLEHGRLAGVLLDNVIADRYGLPRPTLRQAATVAEGDYAIGVRRDAVALRTAIDEALSAMIRDGELRQILMRWHLWNEHQAALGQHTATESSAQQQTSTLTLEHLKLFLRGALVTVVISAFAMVLAIGGGLLLSVARRFGGRAATSLATVYVELFRGTPVLLQLYVLYYGLAPVLRLDAFTAAVIGLGMNYAAYEAELYRAGLDAVPVGQTEAALSLGMSRGMTLRRIVLPQAVRIALPGITNDFIALLKDSSLVSVITVVELTKQMTITAVDVRGWLLPGVLCAALYLALSYPLSRFARRLERRLMPVPT